LADWHTFLIIFLSEGQRAQLQLKSYGLGFAKTQLKPAIHFAQVQLQNKRWR